MSLLDRLPKNLPFVKNQGPQENFFAINIGHKKLTASVWTVEGKSLRVLNSAEVAYQSEDDPSTSSGLGLIEAANTALDEALLDITPEPEKILFGVPDGWLQDDNLKEGYLKILRHLVKELDIKPMAYVSTTHAITHFLQKQTGVPSTTILVAVGDPLSVTVVKGGKILGTKQIARGSDLPVDIQKILLSFNGIEVLPSKISLFGEGNLDKFKDELTTFTWLSELPFLHLPKVEILDKGIEIKAVSLAGASEISPEAVLSGGVVPELKSTPALPLTEETNIKISTRSVPEEVGAGFIAGDIEMEGQRMKMEGQNQVALRQQDAVREYQESVGDTHEPNPMMLKLQALMAAPLGFLKSKGIKIPEDFKIGGYSFGRNLLIPVVVLLVLLAGYFFLVKAQVNLYVDPKVLEKDAQVIADPKATSVDQANSVIPGKVIDMAESGSGTGNATGQKQVGDPSRGTVTIRNKSSSDHNFSQGTVLVGSNGLKFTLDSGVNVASPSSDFSGITWGKASGVNVTASQIGPDSNLASGTILTIQGQASSDFDAQVETGLSGGTSKNVQIVTADDQKRLLAQVSSQLRQKAQNDLQGKLTGDLKVLSEGLDENITGTSYSKNPGDQASDFTLNLTAHYKGTAYSDNDLKTMVSKLVQTNVPAGYDLSLANTETQADVSKLEPDGRLIFLAKFKANLLPKLDTNSIKNQIKGKSPTEAASILQSIDNVIGSDIVLHPQLPGPLARLPFLGSNITINVGTK